MAGINAQRVVFAAFVLSGALAGLAGLHVPRHASATSPSSPGLGFELKSVAAVVVGGVTIFGGSGSVIGVLIGAVLVDTIDNSASSAGPSSASSGARRVLGVLILAAVTVDTLFTRRLIAWRSRRAHAAREAKLAQEART